MKFLFNYMYLQYIEIMINEYNVAWYVLLRNSCNLKLNFNFKVKYCGFVIMLCQYINFQWVIFFTILIANTILPIKHHSYRIHICFKLLSPTINLLTRCIISCGPVHGFWLWYDKIRNYRHLFSCFLLQNSFFNIYNSLCH